VAGRASGTFRAYRIEQAGAAVGATSARNFPAGGRYSFEVRERRVRVMFARTEFPRTMRCALLAEPHHPLSEGVRGLLGPLFEVIVMVAEETSLVDALGRMEAAVAVVDLSLLPGGGLAMIRRVHDRFPAVTLVVIGAHDAPGVARAVVAAGAYGFVPKAALASELVPVVEQAMRTPAAVAAMRGRMDMGDAR